jgi:hypothetical protein
MENKNEIGKIFKDKLDLLDKKPGDHVWASIENDLNKKRKRRMLFWLIPGLLTVGIAISTLFFLETDQEKNNSTKTQQKQITISKSNSSQVKNRSSETTQKQTIVSESNTDQDKNKSSKTQQSQDLGPKSTVSKSKPITKLTTEQSSETKTTIRKSRTEKLIKQSSKLIASTDEYEEYEVVKKYKVIVKKNKTITTTSKNLNPKTIKTSPKKNTEHPGEKVTTKRKKPVKSNKKAPIVTTTKTIEEVDNNSDLKKNETKPISNTEKTEEIKKDSIAIKPQPEKKQAPKREYVKKEYPEQENETDAEYSVSVYYGPAIFGTLSNQSTINESFDDVSKSHPITSHYGFYFKTMYGKYGFKAGIAKINLKISNHLNNQSNINFDNMVLSNNAIYSVLQNDEQIRLVQKISYYEIPLEFNYAVKKDDTPYGIEAFTGFSVLISDANQLYLSSNNLKSEGIGSTKDLNKMNLSFNLGLGFNYKLTEKFQLYFNPIFKYYLTSFKDNNESKPYSLSIQSGVTYKF